MRGPLVLLLSSIAAAAPAQQATVWPDVATSLRSPHAHAVAWAAHDIVHHHIPTQTRNLLASLQTWGARNGEAAEVVCLHLLDALVQTGAKVPGDAVLPHLRGLTEVPACVLLARDPRQNEGELTACFFAPPPSRFQSVAWWAAGNLLCAQKAPHFGAWLLSQAGWQLEVCVVDVGCVVGPRCGGAIHLDLGDVAHRRLHGFPPVPVYAFTVGRVGPWDEPKPLGRAQIAGGRAAVGYQRTLAAGEYRAGPSSHNRDAYLVAGWLAELAPGCDTCGVQSEIVEFTTEAAFVARVLELRQQFVQRQCDLVAALVANQALTIAEAAAFAPCREVQIRDYRNAAKRALPAVPKPLDAGECVVAAPRVTGPSPR